MSDNIFKTKDQQDCSRPRMLSGSSGADISNASHQCGSVNGQ